MAEYPGIDPSPWIVENLDALINLGFKTEDVKNALRENRGVYSDALDWLVTNGCSIEGMDSDDEIDDLTPVLPTSNDIRPFRDIVRQVLHGLPSYEPSTHLERQKIRNQVELQSRLKDVI